MLLLPECDGGFFVFVFVFFVYLFVSLFAFFFLYSFLPFFLPFFLSFVFLGDLAESKGFWSPMGWGTCLKPGVSHTKENHWSIQGNRTDRNI